jgi:hypothetical protein
MTALIMGPAVVNIAGVRAGDQNLFTLTMSRDGVPVDLTGSTVTAQARLTALTEESLDAVVEITDAPGGAVSVRWPGEDVRTWLAGQATVKGVWDLQVANGAEDPVTVIAGGFGAEMDVTR